MQRWEWRDPPTYTKHRKFLGREQDQDPERGRDNKKRARQTSSLVQQQNDFEAGQELETWGPTTTEFYDDNNRECKRCELTFKTSKAFLKHREWVHGAKLKKKEERGVPTTQGREESDGVPGPST